MVVLGWKEGRMREWGASEEAKVLEEFERNKGIREEDSKRSLPDFDVKLIKNYDLLTEYEQHKINMLHELKTDGQGGGEDPSPEDSDSETTPFHKKLEAPFVIDSRINEVWLFHGTSKKAVYKILQNNFREEQAGNRRHRGLYGSYCYFTNHLCKALQYSRPFIYRIELLFLQRGITADRSAQGYPEINDPPDWSETVSVMFNNTGVEGMVPPCDLFFEPLNYEAKDTGFQIESGETKNLKLKHNAKYRVTNRSPDPSNLTQFCFYFIVDTSYKQLEVKLVLRKDYRWPVFLSRVILGPNPFTTYRPLSDKAGEKDLENLETLGPEGVLGKKEEGEEKSTSIFAPGIAAVKENISEPVSFAECWRLKTLSEDSAIDAEKIFNDRLYTRKVGSEAAKIHSEEAKVEAAEKCEELGYGPDCYAFEDLSNLTRYRAYYQDETEREASLLPSRFLQVATEKFGRDLALWLSRQIRQGNVHIKSVHEMIEQYHTENCVVLADKGKNLDVLFQNLGHKTIPRDWVIGFESLDEKRHPIPHWISFKKGQLSSDINDYTACLTHNHKGEVGVQIHNEFMVSKCHEKVYMEYLLLFKYSSLEDLHMDPYFEQGWTIYKLPEKEMQFANNDRGTQEKELFARETEYYADISAKRSAQFKKEARTALGGTAGQVVETEGTGGGAAAEGARQRTPRKELIDIYTLHSPDKVDDVDRLIAKWALKPKLGGVQGLLERVRQKYLNRDKQ
tara:strand:+ start:1 stop:2205 length:2205 start_codon:yes stop_codon:yes gene_type:complete